jgi:proprotein convertase subtilisin/kexin type 5
MRCVSQCPSSTFGNNQNWTCIDNCPPTVFGYKLDLANLCIEYCPSPFFAFVTTRTCVGDCGAGFFGDPVTRICTACPDTCPTCSALTQCLTCSPNMFLAFGSCFTTCPSGIYANNASMSCVYAVGCPAGTYANNDTSSCSTVCPSKQFADVSTKMCQLCPYTCDSCTSTKVCQTCITSAAYSNVTKLCYAFCSPSEIYSYNGTCYEICPNTTYLDFTNINCQACNSICATCSLTATNCTSCSSTYLYNLTCISQCPSGFYGSNNACIICTPDVKSCKTPLTFSVSTSTVNYQTVLFMKFS